MAETAATPKKSSKFTVVLICIIGLFVALVVIHIRDGSFGSFRSGHRDQSSILQPKPLPTEDSPAFITITDDPDWSKAVAIPNRGLQLQTRIVTRDIWWLVRADMDPQRTSLPLAPASNSGKTRLTVIPYGSQCLQFQIAPGQRVKEGQVMYWYAVPTPLPYS